MTINFRNEEHQEFYNEKMKEVSMMKTIAMKNLISSIQTINMLALPTRQHRMKDIPFSMS